MSTNHRAHSRKANGVANAANKVARDTVRAGRKVASTAHAESDHLLDSVKELGTSAGRFARESLDQVRGLAEEYYEDGRERVVEAEQSVEERIRTKPLQSLLFAAGAGFVIGWWFTRDRS